MLPASLHRSRLYRRDPEAVEFGLLFLFLVAATLWQSLAVQLYRPLASALPAPVDSPFVAGAVVSYGLGSILAAAVYVRVRGLPVDLGLPGREDVPVVAVAVVAPLALVGAGGGVGHLVGTSLSEATQTFYAGDVAPGLLVQTAVLPALLGGVGYALLFNVATQGTLRRLLAPRHAVVATVAVAASYRVIDLPSVVRRPTAGTVVAFLALTGLAVALGFTYGLAYRVATGTPPREAVDARYLPLVAAGLVGFVGVLQEFAGTADAIHWTMWVGVIGVAAVGYERSRSPWVPALAFAVLLAALDGGAFLEAWLGLVDT